MSRLNLRRRLARIESGCRRPPISAEELAYLIIGAPVEVIGELFSHPLLHSSSANKPAVGETAADPIRCSRCGHTGPFSEMRPATTAQYLRKKTNVNSEPITVPQLSDGFDRATPTILADALCLAYAELDRAVELMKVECLVCGHAKLHLREQTGLGSEERDT
jgi:hypothetical protein